MRWILSFCFWIHQRSWDHISKERTRTWLSRFPTWSDISTATSTTEPLYKVSFNKCTMHTVSTNKEDDHLFPVIGRITFVAICFARPSINGIFRDSYFVHRRCFFEKVTNDPLTMFQDPRCGHTLLSAQRKNDLSSIVACFPLKQKTFHPRKF